MESNSKNFKQKRNQFSVNENTVYGKVPPQAKELEEAVLGAIMLEKSAIDIVVEILKPECFYSEANQRIFKAMQNLSDRHLPIDLLTVVEQLKTNGDLDIVGGPFYVSKLTNSVVSSANIETHSRIVLQKYLSREIIRTGGEMINAAYEESTDVFDMLDEVEEGISKLRMGNIKKHYRSLHSVAVESINKLEELRLSDETITGVHSGFNDLDMVTCGWQPSDLLILAARPSVGKTAFAITLAKKATTSPKPVSVGIFSLEMNDKQLVNRILSQESDVWLWRFKNGCLDDQQMDQINKAATRLNKSKIFIDDTPGLSIKNFRAKAKIMKRKENIGMIIVDYLQLMTAPGIQNREQQISEISRQLKITAKELDIPIIALSQLNRDIEKGGAKVQREPQISDLRESGAIEQDADMVMFLYKPSESEIEEDAGLNQTFYLKIAKHRNGSLEKLIGKFVKETQTHEYLKVVDSRTLQPLGPNWKPVDSLPAPTINYSEPKREQSKDDLPF